MKASNKVLRVVELGILQEIKARDFYRSIASQLPDKGANLKLDIMADALMKYETINELQIKDIMEGREPRPPADWDEPSEPGEPVKQDTAEDSKGPAPLGGPAGQH